MWGHEAAAEPTNKRPRIDEPPNATDKQSEATTTTETATKASCVGSGYAIKVTKPDWLGDIEIHGGVISARCGGRSPARALGNYMLKQLWDEWVVACQKHITVDVAVKPCGSATNQSCTFKFAVSPLLLGIMGPVRVVESISWKRLRRRQRARDDEFESISTKSCTENAKLLGTVDPSYLSQT
ncbi:hypothetical protein Pelo_18646 [Pelomyxa schiedti]|nr:hypothetical protein Pelo_18646 [Pelomyxa schiedti]